MKNSDPTSVSKANGTPPVLLALTALAAGIAAAALAALVGARLFGVQTPAPAAALLSGFIAATAGHLLKLPRWWLPILLIFPPAAWVSQSLALPGWVYLAAFLLLAVVYWNAAGERVPLYLTNVKTWRALEPLLPPGTSSLADLGCGLGGVLFHLAKKHPDVSFTGIESAPVPYALARIRGLMSGRRNVVIRFGSFWNDDLGKYDVVYAFLSPHPMDRLFAKVRREMRTGGVFISNSFAVPDQAPDKTIEVDDRRKTKLLIWRL